MTDDEIKELITRRRRQVIVHSCLYYDLGTSIIPDEQFDRWAYQLVSLQKLHPELARLCDWHYEFRDFDGSTGYDLPTHGEWVVRKAKQLLEYEERLNND